MSPDLFRQGSVAVGRAGGLSQRPRPPPPTLSVVVPLNRVVSPYDGIRQRRRRRPRGVQGRVSDSSHARAALHALIGTGANDRMELAVMSGERGRGSAKSEERTGMRPIKREEADEEAGAPSASVSHHPRCNAYRVSCTPNERGRVRKVAGGRASERRFITHLEQY